MVMDHPHERRAGGVSPLIIDRDYYSTVRGQCGMRAGGVSPLMIVRLAHHNRRLQSGVGCPTTGSKKSVSPTPPGPPFVRGGVLLAPLLLLLALIGCQTVVDPGRSQGVITAPPSGPLLIPPQVPATNQPDPSGVIRQPVSAVLQLPQTTAAEAKYHTVSQGETWSSISQKYQLSVQDLTNSNGLDPATPLQPGQMVYLPSN